MILVLRALGVGDLATAVPALRGLRRATPGEEIWLAAPGWLAPLLPLVGAVDRLLPVPERVVRAGPAFADRTLAGILAGEVAAPRLGVNLHGRGPQSHRFLAAGRPERTLGFACPAADHRDGPVWRPDEHEVDRWCRMLRWYGVPADRTDLDLRPPGGTGPNARRTGLTVVHPGGKEEARRWPAGRFATVARVLARQGHRVVVTGSVDERRLARHVAEAAGLAADAVVAGRTPLPELAGLVAGARLVVSGDTGVGHLATAYRTPSVLLFGPTLPTHWGPPADRPWHRALWRGPALTAVGTDEVLAATAEVTGAAGVAGAAAGPTVGVPG